MSFFLLSLVDSTLLMEKDEVEENEVGGGGDGCEGVSIPKSGIMQLCDVVMTLQWVSPSS